MWIVTVIPLLITLLVIKYLPAQVPMHYDLEGNIDRWGSKYEQLILPVVTITMTLFMQLVIVIYDRKSKKTDDDKQRAELCSNIKVLYIVAVAMAVMFTVMQMAFLYQALEATPDTKVQTVDINQIVTVILGIIMVVFGNYMPKTKRNGIVGFRTSVTMKSDENWKKANKFAGIVFVIVGAAMIVLSVMVQGNVAMVVTLALLMVAMMVCLMYTSKIEVNDENKCIRNN